MCEKLDSQVISFSICPVAYFIRSALMMLSSLLTSSPASLKWCPTSCMHFTMTPSMSVLPERCNMNPKLEIFVGSFKSWGKKLSISSTLCNADRLLNNVVKLATAQCLIPEKLRGDERVEENVLSWGPSELNELQEFICTICMSLESSDISQVRSQLIITRSNKWWYEQIGSMSNVFGKWGHVHSLPCFFLFLGPLLANEMKWNGTLIALLSSRFSLGC